MNRFKVLFLLVFSLGSLSFAQSSDETELELNDDLESVIEEAHQAMVAQNEKEGAEAVDGWISAGAGAATTAGIFVIPKKWRYRKPLQVGLGAFSVGSGVFVVKNFNDWRGEVQEGLAIPHRRVHQGLFSSVEKLEHEFQDLILTGDNSYWGFEDFSKDLFYRLFTTYERDGGESVINAARLSCSQYVESIGEKIEEMDKWLDKNGTQNEKPSYYQLSAEQKAFINNLDEESCVKAVVLSFTKNPKASGLL